MSEIKIVTYTEQQRIKDTAKRIEQSAVGEVPVKYKNQQQKFESIGKFTLTDFERIGQCEYTKQELFRIKRICQINKKQQLISTLEQKSLKNADQELTKLEKKIQTLRLQQQNSKRETEQYLYQIKKLHLQDHKKKEQIKQNELLRGRLFKQAQVIKDNRKSKLLREWNQVKSEKNRKIEELLSEIAQKQKTTFKLKKQIEKLYQNKDKIIKKEEERIQKINCSSNKTKESKQTEQNIYKIQSGQYLKNNSIRQDSTSKRTSNQLNITKRRSRNGQHSIYDERISSISSSKKQSDQNNSDKNLLDKNSNKSVDKTQLINHNEKDMKENEQKLTQQKKHHMNLIKHHLLQEISKKKKMLQRLVAGIQYKKRQISQIQLWLKENQQKFNQFYQESLSKLRQIQKIRDNYYYNRNKVLRKQITENESKFAKKKQQYQNYKTSSENKQSIELKMLERNSQLLFINSLKKQIEEQKKKKLKIKKCLIEDEVKSFEKILYAIENQIQSKISKYKSNKQYEMDQSQYTKLQIELDILKQNRQREIERKASSLLQKLSKINQQISDNNLQIQTLEGQNSSFSKQNQLIKEELRQSRKKVQKDKQKELSIQIVDDQQIKKETDNFLLQLKNNHISLLHTFTKELQTQQREFLELLKSNNQQKIYDTIIKQLQKQLKLKKQPKHQSKKDQEQFLQCCCKII